MSTSPGRADAPPRRVDGSMSLLVDVMSNTLDEAYAERAKRRAGTTADPGGAPPAPSRPTGRLAGALALVLLGLVTGTAVGQVRERAAGNEGLREQLAAEVAERDALSDDLSGRAAELRAEVNALRDAALDAGTAGQRLADQVQALEVAAGTAAVVGPGILLTVDDAPVDAPTEQDAVLRGGTPLDGRVLDRDLQEIVNGLWAAGAEAVAVNGVRLSARSAIRSAGEAVLVDFRPVSPPYRIEAIGRPADLEVGFADGRAGRYLETLTSISGISYELERADRLELTGATEPQLRAVQLREPP
ncbi:MAG: DUF881 domain-containing protein [Actinomycetes bacterium]